MSYFYGGLADYGQALVRPLLSIGIAVFLFWYLYLWLFWGITGDQPDGGARAALFQLSIEQVVKPFAIWGKASPIVEPLFGKVVPFSLKLLTALHSIASLSFFALFILALRWHFKRG